MRLISITALVFRFVENLKKNQLKINKGTSNLKPFDNTGGANLWIRFPQQDIIKSDNYKQLKTDLKEEKSARIKESGINQCKSAKRQKKKETLDFSHKFLESAINLIYAFLL